ncbi:arginine--tRNA ligase [Candidatus Uhrbacteria bacterium]|nr:arginine--tRNA ligase [Candidatus Uhrbacteria bacterium]
MASVWSTILEELRSAIGAAVPTVESVTFEIPPNSALGDVAVPCFQLARVLKQPPTQIAARIAEALGAHPLVAQATVAGPYVNLALDATEVARRVLGAVADGGERYGGMSDKGRLERERIVLEFISPNANKPLHLGHLRNAFLGEAIARLLETRGHEVHRVCLVNDRGVHIMKSMLAYQRWGQGTTPESEGIKGDHFVGNWYVVFAQKSSAERKALALPDDQPTPLEQEAAEMLRKWEANDSEIRVLWTQMTDWVLTGFRESYATLGVTFEREYRESDIYGEGRAFVADALASGALVKDAKGNTVAPLKDRLGIDDKVVERADGTTVYATQDLALALRKERDLHPDRSIIITGNEQDFYFRQLFAIFKLLGMSDVERSEHRSYGMVELPEGKMKSREGTVVDADDLIAELTRLAEEEIRKRADVVPGEPAAGTDEPPVVVSDTTLARAKDIALAAVKFYLLLVTPETTVTFDPKASLAFTGKTGPYLQYMHARMCSIQRKANVHLPQPSSDGHWSGETESDFSPSLGEGEVEGEGKLLIHPTEKQLLLRIARFPDVVAEAADQLDPSTLAQFLYDFAKAFADFYRDVPVIKAEPDVRAARLALLDATRITLARGLTLLGITPLEEM